MKTPKNQTPHLFQKLTHLVCAAGLAAIIAQTAQAQLPLPIYEPFPASYTNTTDDSTPVPAGGVVYPARRIGNGNTTAVWPIGGAQGGGSALVVGGAAGLSYPGLFAAPNTIGLFIRTNNTTATRSRAILFSTNNTGTVYASFLINVQQAPSPAPIDTLNTGSGRLFVKFDSASSGNGGTAMAGVWLTESNTLAISKSSNAAWGADTITPLAAGTHLVVLRYTFNAGADDDTVDLWIDPSSASFNGAEVNVPPPTLSLTTGTDVPSLSSFYVYHIGSEVIASMFLDEIRLANTWADVTSTQALCTAASISTQPTSKTVNEGVAANYAVIAGGTGPTFQWQVSTDAGSSWSNTSTGVGATSQSYQTAPTTLTDSGKKFRVIATVSCGGGSSVTSAPVDLTVVAALASTNGVVVDDMFQDFFYNNLPYGISNSVWLTSTASSLDASGGTAMMGTVASGTSVTWVGFFTDDQNGTNLPVHLAVGQALKGTLVFRANNIVSSNGNFRIGFFSFNDGGVRPTTDGFNAGSFAANTRGYMTTINYGNVFSANPFSLFARNNLSSGDLLGTTANYASLGSGPTGQTGAPAFQNGVDYTAVFTINRQGLSSVEFTTQISGGGTNWSHTRVDNTYAYARFDSVAVRAGSLETAGNPFEFTRLLVEVVPGAPTPAPLNISASGGNVTLTWTNSAFKLQADTSVTGAYTNVTGATSPYIVPASGAAQFFRLIWP